MSTPLAQVAGAQDSLETTHYVKQSLLDAKIIYCLAPWIMCGIYDIQVTLIFKFLNLYYQLYEERGECNPEYNLHCKRVGSFLKIG